MWSKFSNAIKSLQEDSHTDVASTSRSQYLPNANLSTSSLVSNTEVLPPISSSPGSPSKQAKRSVFRRMSKAARRDEGDVIPTPLKLSIGLPKRVKSHLHLNGNSCVFVTVPFVFMYLANPKYQVLRRRFPAYQQTPALLRIPSVVIKILLTVTAHSLPIDVNAGIPLLGKFRSLMLKRQVYINSSLALSHFSTLLYS